MNSKQEELQQMYDKELSAAADTQPTVVVLDSNWRALIEPYPFTLSKRRMLK
ncbi:hypothetical protein SAMN02910353_02876 [Ruminococcus sp. YRD2003]|uniref:hypothetical protein n=1 Tax=Ruminococcus sp. YRD2003 TaxID=1452313 RepID=UPI0008C23D7A|nr:hypothetical protein SAMN02910353_02876 [Ruminococcus flavefaciens]